MSAPYKFADSKAAKAAGWFSRRHKRSDVNDEERYKRETREIAKRQSVEERADLRAKRSSREQLAVLDARLGEGRGAKKERARLGALL